MVSAKIASGQVVSLVNALPCQLSWYDDVVAFVLETCADVALWNWLQTINHTVDTYPCVRQAALHILGHTWDLMWSVLRNLRVACQKRRWRRKGSINRTVSVLQYDGTSSFLPICQLYKTWSCLIYLPVLWASLYLRSSWDCIPLNILLHFKFTFYWAGPGGIGRWPGWLTIVLQCYDTVG